MCLKPADPLKMLLICMMLFTSAQAQESSVYFSSLQSIRVFANNTTAVVFQDPSQTGALVCNPNPRDHRIYWIDMETENTGNNNIPMIKKGIPNNESSVEMLITRDLHDPRSLAVDWAANNIYFSQRRDVGGNQGRIEVVSSDGRKRRVLFDTLDSVGSLAINILTGHLYFVEDVYIDRCYLDGSNRERILSIFDAVEISGLAIDVASNTLYWTQNGGMYKIRSYNLDQFTGTEVFSLSSPLLETNMRLFDVSVFNNSIYWTISRGQDEITLAITSPGSLFHARMDNLTMDSLTMTHTRLLASGNDLDPHGVCTFYNVTTMSSPCHDASNPCLEDAFCFAVPAFDGVGTMARCACPTGLKLNTDNSCSDVPQNFLIYPHHLASGVETARTELRIIPLDSDQDSNFVDTQLPIDLHFTKAIFVTYDPVLHKVYWTEEQPPTIMRANIDGTGAEVFINSSISHLESIAVDPYSGNLYWADSGLDIISVVKITNPQIRCVLFRNVRQPQGLALDVHRGYMYWSDLDSVMPAVERASMDGTGRQIISENQIQTPTNVAVDPLTGYVYWIELSNRQSTIVRWVDGDETVLAISRPDLRVAFGLAVDGDYVYWTDRFNSKRSIGRADKITGSNSAVLVSGVSGLGGVVVVNTTAPPVVTMCGESVADANVVGRCNHFCLRNSNRGPTCKCAENHVMRDSICVDSKLLVFIANSTYLTQLNVTQLGMSTFMQLSNNVHPFPGEGALVTAMDTYVKDSKVFWIDSLHKQICSRSWESDFQACIVTCCLDAPEDLAVDWLGQNLYWTDSRRHVIEVSNFTGYGRTIIARVPENLGGPSHIALDPFGGYLYWASKTEPKLYRTRMDGSQRDNVLIRHYSSVNARVLGISLNFSLNGDLKIYWAVVDPSDDMHRILRSDLLTSEGPLMFRVDQHQVVLESDRLDVTTTLQVFKGNLYFNSRERFSSAIVEANLLVGDTENTVFNRDNIPDFDFSQFVLAHHSIQQGEHRCGVNHCTDTSGLCLVENGTTGVCHCWPRSVTIPDTDTTTDIGAICLVTDSFLVLATESEFSYLPVIRAGYHDNMAIKGTVQPLPFAPEGSVVDFVYDPINDSVLWVESGSNVLHGVNLDFESEWTILLSNSSNVNESFNPFSLAYDWAGGHVVLTETDAFQLKLVTANGREHGSLLDLTVERPFVIEKPGEVVFDALGSTLYWTQREGKLDLGRGLKFMHLSDLSTISTIPLDGRLINHLTFEPVSRSLYWLSHGAASSRVEHYNLTSRSVGTIAENADQVEALTALSVEEPVPEGEPGTMVAVPYVFWYNRTDRYLYNSTVDGVVERYVRWDTSKTVVKILGHRTTSTLTYACRNEEQPCSHICVPGDQSSQHSCYCPVYSTMSSDTGHCTASTCGPHAISCGDDFGECYPGVYFCDGIKHCKNNFDEQCSCNLTVENGCFGETGSGGSTLCYSHQQRCDNILFCPNGDDESMCCGEDMFGCYTNGNCGNDDLSTFECLLLNNRCDGYRDCVDGSDEMDCATSEPTLEMTSTPALSGENTLAIIISAVIISVIFMVVAVVIVVYVLSVFWRKRDEYRVGHGHHSISYSTHSPQLRTDSTSDYSSEFSHGTNITQVGNGSNTQSPCADKAAANLTSHVPPPSPISTIQMQPRHSLALSEDEVSTFSHGFSEYNAPPPPPCPSINYDNISGNMSFSVSQTQFPATINSNNIGGSSNNYHYQYPQGGMGGSGRPPGRNPNPLHASNPSHQHNGGGGNGGGGVTFHLYRGVSNNQQTVNYNPYHHHSCHTHPDITELDDTMHSDTASTISIATEEGNPDAFHFDSSMPHLPPPGRPPSPVTICSYPPGLHRSPRSSSASFSSEV